MRTQHKGKMVKVYVAGKWGDRHIIADVICQLEEKGIEITHNWTTSEVFDDDKKTEEYAVLYSELDIDGVRRADVMIAIITDPDYAYRGTCTELGAALGLRKPVYVIDPYDNSGFASNIFSKHRLVKKVDHISELIAILLHSDQKHMEPDPIQH